MDNIKITKAEDTAELTEKLFSYVGDNTVIVDSLEEGKYLYKYEGKMYTPSFKEIMDIIPVTLFYDHDKNRSPLDCMMRAFSINVIDSVLISLLMNEDLCPGIDHEIVKDFLKGRLMKTKGHMFLAETHPVKAYFKSVKEPIRSLYKQSPLVNFFRSEGRINLKAYHNMIKLFGGGLEPVYFYRPGGRADHITVIPDGDKPIIDFKTGKINFITNPSSLSFYKVDIDIRNIGDNYNDDYRWQKFFNNLCAMPHKLYEAYVKQKGYVDEELLMHIGTFEFQDTDIETYRFRDNTIFNYYSYNNSSRNFLGVHLEILKHRLQIIDKLYNASLSSNDMRRMISLASFRMPRVYKKSIHEDMTDYGCEFTGTVRDVLRHEFHKIEVMQDNNEENTIEYKTHVDETFKRYGLYRDKIKRKYVRDVYSVLNKKKIWELLYDLNKQDFKVLMSKDTHSIKTFSNAVYYCRLDTRKEQRDILFQPKNLHYMFDSGFLENDFCNSWSLTSESLTLLCNMVKRGFKFSEGVKVIEYVTDDCSYRQGIKSGASELYEDYLRMYGSLVEKEYNTWEGFELTPYSLKMAHDITMVDYYVVKDKIDEKTFLEKYEDIKKLDNKLVVSSGRKLRFYLPEGSNDIREEGKALNHCVGSYVRKIIEGDCLIIFLRDELNPQDSLYTIELRKNSSGGYRLGQTKGKNNNNLRPEYKERVKHIVDKYINNPEEELKKVG